MASKKKWVPLEKAPSGFQRLAEPHPNPFIGWFVKRLAHPETHTLANGGE